MLRPAQSCPQSGSSVPETNTALPSQSLSPPLSLSPPATLVSLLNHTSTHGDENLGPLRNWEPQLLSASWDSTGIPLGAQGSPGPEDKHSRALTAYHHGCPETYRVWLWHELHLDRHLSLTQAWFGGREHRARGPEGLLTWDQGPARHRPGQRSRLQGRRPSGRASLQCLVCTERVVLLCSG